LAWFKLEQAARFPALQPLTGIAFVRRPPSTTSDTPQDYGTFSPGAQVIEIAASIDPTTFAVAPGAETNLTALCSGLGGTNVDARRPAVSWDGTQIAFAARTSATDPFHVYIVENGVCTVQADIDATPVTDSTAHPFTSNGELIHNFDPSFTPDGGIVFASTRGNVTNVDSFGYFGPQRTPADPAKLNSNLYVLDKPGGTIRQLTFLLNQELTPSFMRDGRVIMVTEKRAPGFYQLAGRRQNLDGGDYHPLFGQRDSIGYDQLTDVVELTDKNFAFILSDKLAAHGAGTLAVLNRSVGVDQNMQAGADFAQDPSALDFPDPNFYQHSLRIIDPQATGKPGATVGAYRSPARLPSKNLLVSYAANVTDITNFSGNFDIVELDPTTGARTPVVSGPEDELWPVAVGPRYNREIFHSRLDEPNGATQVLTDDVHKDHAEVTYLDLPLLTSLLFQNTRTGREFTPQMGVSFWEDLPPDQGITSMPAGSPFVFNDTFGSVFVKRVVLGSPSLFGDGSAAVSVPGGVPIVMQVTPVSLADAPGAVAHFQREEIQFYPGEVVRQSFRRGLFDGLCAGCHGSVSGLELQISPNPDILSQASMVQANGATPNNLIIPPPSPASATQGPVAP
ncbi:MAG TPA: hypothetical protein VGM29_02820, partial [Polyangiaceae bacterium]